MVNSTELLGGNLMKHMCLNISAQQAKDILLSKIRTDKSILRLAYTIFKYGGSVFGKLYGDHFWIIEFDDEENANSFHMFPKRFYFGSITEEEGKAIINGRFKFPWVYGLISGCWFLYFLLSYLIKDGENVIKAVIESLALTMVGTLILLLYGYFGSRANEKKMLLFLKELYGDFIVEEA